MKIGIYTHPLEERVELPIIYQSCKNLKKKTNKILIK